MTYSRYSSKTGRIKNLELIVAKLLLKCDLEFLKGELCENNLNRVLILTQLAEHFDED